MVGDALRFLRALIFNVLLAFIIAFGICIGLATGLGLLVLLALALTASLIVVS